MVGDGAGWGSCLRGGTVEAGSSCDERLRRLGSSNAGGIYDMVYCVLCRVQLMGSVVAVHLPGAGLFICAITANS